MDKRYTIQMEFTGHPSGKPQHVVRFCGDFVSASRSLEGAQLSRDEHVAERGFDLLTSFDDGDARVLWLKRGTNHRVSYGAESLTTINEVAAAQKYGECVLHSLQCRGKLD